MPELSLYFLNDTAYPDPTYEPPFTFVGDVSLLKYTIFSSVDCEFGFRWSVDNQFQVISTDTYQLTGGNEESVSMPITARYVQIFVNNIASNPCDLKVQVFFLTNFLGSIGNTGATGSQGIQGATGAPGIQGATGATGAGTDVSLTSVGGTSLVADGVGPDLEIRGLSNNNGIAIVDTGTTLEIQNIVYERNGNLIEPVTTPANVISGGTTNTIPANCNQCGIVCGTSNSMNNCDNSCIAGGNLNSIDPNANNAFIGGGSNNFIDNTSSDTAIVGGTSNNTGTGNFNCFIAGGILNALDNNNNNSFCIGGDNNICDDSLLNSGIVGGQNNVTSNATNSIIAGAVGCNLRGTRTQNSAIIASVDGRIATAGGNGDGKNCVIIGCNASRLSTASGTASGTGNGAYSSVNSAITNRSEYCTILGCSNSVISGTGEYNGIYSTSDSSIIGNRTNNSVMLGAVNSTIATGGGGDGQNNVVIGSIDCSIGVNSGVRMGVYSCANCTMNNRSRHVAMIGATGCSSNDSNDSYCVIVGGTDNSFDNAQNCSIIAGIDNIVHNNSDRSVVIGGQLNNIDSNIQNSCILGGLNNLITAGSDSCSIIGGDDNEINGNRNRSIVGGNNCKCINSGCFMFSDSNGGTQLTSVSNNTFLVRCVNGATFFTNNTNTTGVTIGAGGGSWASVSDVNKKENLVELDCQDFMNKMEDLPIYQYNYIGNSKEQHCFGPTAQDWYKLFPTEKDQLTIETMDMIGVLMATVKNLNKRVKDLESKIAFM